MDNGLFTGAVYLDLKKAFDTVDCETLLYKLRCLGISGTEHMWFANCLQERKQCVRCECSILDPILFDIFNNEFINDFPQVVQHAKVTLYADDTILLYSSNSVHDIQNCLISDLKLAAT
jgi:1-acyl-sn-glycerol-3-phosphate acyltransferase